ncbi:hypothetical protein ASG36_08940 [Geodermatophilus sp. Leaf369]|nr:hypothetical protein ASG36_08940 [Geodermatophilus sp. Leaf369]
MVRLTVRSPGRTERGTERSAPLGRTTTDVVRRACTSGGSGRTTTGAGAGRGGSGASARRPSSTCGACRDVVRSAPVCRGRGAVVGVLGSSRIGTGSSSSGARWRRTGAAGWSGAYRRPPQARCSPRGPAPQEPSRSHWRRSQPTRVCSRPANRVGAGTCGSVEASSAAQRSLTSDRRGRGSRNSTSVSMEVKERAGRASSTSVVGTGTAVIVIVCLLGGSGPEPGRSSGQGRE